MERSKITLIIAFLLYSLNCDFVDAGANFATNPLFRGSHYADIENPRGLTTDTKGDILVKGFNSIIALSENGDNRESSTILNSEGLGLNHGIVHFEDFLYASSATNVYRWPYKSGSRSLITSQPEIVVADIPFGGYSTRSLVVDSRKQLYVTVGSSANVDVDETSLNTRSLIRSFNLSTIPSGGFSFSVGVIVADGLRNVVGIGFDIQGDLWGVDNGVLNLHRPDLGYDIHDDNPADELNRIIIGSTKTSYGYPYCFTKGKLINQTATQLAHPSFMREGSPFTDAWCQIRAHNEPPILPLPAHNAPLGIHFYDGRGCDSADGSFPCTAKGDAFISFHGSKDRDVPDGYFVGWLPFNKTNNRPVGTIIPVIYEPNTIGCHLCFRPVNSIFNNRGHLVVSTDATSELFVVKYTNSKTRSAASANLFSSTAMLTSIGLLALNFFYNKA